MDGDVIARMRQEEADLARKLRAVRDLLAAYGEDVGAPTYRLPSTPTRNPATGTSASSSRDKNQIDGFGRYGRLIVATSMAVMLEHDVAVRTREIVQALDARGVSITGENKVNAVGALLSRSADVVSHGKMGWTLADHARAQKIVSEYAHKRTEASDETTDAPEAASEGGATPTEALSNPNLWPDA